ncbi:MAG TPA: hypothetical protein DCE62_09380 [Glaciecola sp.]|nr:hypothetical protein [Glaciecola sp.]
MVYTQFIQHQVTKPMVAQAKQAKIDFEAILFRDPTGASAGVSASADISPNDEDELALALSLTTADVAFSNLASGYGSTYRAPNRQVSRRLDTRGESHRCRRRKYRRGFS